METLNYETVIMKYFIILNLEVNLEIDILAKYVEKLLADRQ